MLKNIQIVGIMTFPRNGTYCGRETHILRTQKAHVAFAKNDFGADFFPGPIFLLVAVRSKYWPREKKIRPEIVFRKDNL